MEACARPMAANMTAVKDLRMSSKEARPEATSWPANLGGVWGGLRGWGGEGGGAGEGGGRVGGWVGVVGG